MKERPSLLPPLKVGLLALAGTLLLAGCLQERAHYDVGLSTREISGDVDLGPPPEPPGPVLVLVLLYHYKFVQLEGDPVITHPTAQLAPLRSDGSYLVRIPTDVVDAEIDFIAPDRLTDVFRFHKQVGVGPIVYQAKLQPTLAWRSHFYTYLEPQLEHLIVDRRYDLPAQDQQTLTTWINQQTQRLEAKFPHPSEGETQGPVPAEQH